jgi:putative phage-type endonuclease
MLKPHLQLTDTSAMPRAEWLALRTKSIGGSDIGAILGLNPYMSALELYYLYVGSGGDLTKKDSNLAMELGNLLEPTVATLWEHWSGSEESLVRNLTAKTPVAQCSVVPALIRNPAYPHLHANIDRYIDRSHEGRQGILEIKTIAGLAADKYESGLPISYIIQIMHYLLVCEEEYAELAMLKDGRFLEVFALERNQALIDKMLAKGGEFWAKVEEGRRIWADATTSEELRHHWIAELEPAPDDTPAYEAFLKQRWRTGENPDVPLRGTDDHRLALDGYIEASKAIKTHKGRQQLYKNQVLHQLALHQADLILFEDGSKATFRADKNGDRSLRVSLPKKISA